MITAFLLDLLTTIPQSICGTAVVLYIFYILLGEKPAWKNIVLYTAGSLVLSSESVPAGRINIYRAIFLKIF